MARSRLVNICTDAFGKAVSSKPFLTKASANGRSLFNSDDGDHAVRDLNLKVWLEDESHSRVRRTRLP